MTEKRSFSERVGRQRAFYNTGITKDLSWRKGRLRMLKRCIKAWEEHICEALGEDLRKSAFESFATELSFCYQELDHALKRIASWSEPKRVRTPFALHPASSHFVPEPLGVTLIIAPWNYPFHLTVAPLIAAMAAGNCAILKPSELAPHTSSVMSAMIADCFDPAYIDVVEGGAEETQALLMETFDYIFFTGGNRVGRIIMEAAAKHLTPVTLELGGKSPVIVDHDADCDRAATRIVWGKFLNAGQTCIAPDHVLVHRSVKEELLEGMKRIITSFYGSEPSLSRDFGRIVNDGHFTRLAGYLADGTVVCGGRTLREERYIAPTILDNVSRDSTIMKEEIFGPILPVLSFDSLDEVLADLRGMEKPLALYYFSRSRAKQKRVIRETSSGGVAINNTIVQIAPRELPFGGVGYSGMGKYHGKAGFDAFSNLKGVYRQTIPLDVRIKYPPYGNRLSWMRKWFKWFA